MAPGVDPFCISCGAVIGWEELFGGRIHGEDQLGAPDPKNPVAWGSLYRTIFQPTEAAPYRLSGIARYDNYFRDLLTPPWDRDGDNSDHGPNFGPLPDKSNVILYVNFIRQDDQNYYTHGYIIHANCWCLIERIIGPKTEKHLELLINVLRQRWKEHPFEIDQYRGGPYAETPVIEGPRWAYPEFRFPGVGVDLDYVPEKFYYGALDGYNRTVSDLVTRNIISLRDPIKIPKRHHLIRRCIYNRAREQMKRKTRSWYPTSNENSEHPVSLPLDIKFRILDCLRGGDVQNAFLAFGWKLPDSYFQARVPKKLIFEVEEHGLAEIDWKRLFFGVEDLLESSPEMENRQRIFKILEATKELFVTMRGFNNFIRD